MSNNNKSKYYKSVRTFDSIRVLPSFINTKTDGTFFSLSNPQNIILDKVLDDINESSLNLNPMSMSLALPSVVYVADDLEPKSIPNGATLEEVSLYDFHSNLPTRISNGTAANITTISGNTGFSYKDIHYISPLIYSDDTGSTSTDDGYVFLREGTWLTDDLISIYNTDLTKIKSYSLSESTQDLSAATDEWIELVSSNFTYTLNNPYVVAGSIHVFNPFDLSAGVGVTYTDYTVTNGNQLVFNNKPDSGLIVEYSYVPSPVLNSIFYYNQNHDTNFGINSSLKKPTGFSYLETPMHDTNSITEGVTYDHLDSISREVLYEHYKAENSELFIRVDSAELSIGQTATVSFDYYATYSYNMYDYTNNYISGATHTLVLNDHLDSDDEIISDKITVLDNSDVDITSNYTYSATGGVSYLIENVGPTAGANVHIPYRKKIQVTKSTIPYYESITDVLTVGGTSSSEQFYLSYPYHSGATSDYLTDISLLGQYHRGFTMDVASAGLAIGATFDITYMGMDKTKEHSNRLWIQNMLYVSKDQMETSSTGDNTGATFSAVDTFNDAILSGITAEYSIHDSLSIYDDKIHIVDERFTRPIYSLNAVEGKIKIYSTQEEIEELYNLYWTERDVAHSGGTYTVYTSELPSLLTPVCVRIFHESLAVLSGVSPLSNNTNTYNLRFYDLRTMELLTDLGNFSLSESAHIKAFTFDKEHNLLLFSDTKRYNIQLHYDYYTRIQNEDLTEDLYFRETYSGFSITTSLGATAVSSFDELSKEIVEHSVDHWGRVLGSERWPNESIKEYLTRLTNITKAKGNTSYQRSLDGISSTLGSDSYNVSSLDRFPLRFPVAIQDEQLTLDSNISSILTYPASTIHSVSLYSGGSASDTVSDPSNWDFTSGTTAFGLTGTNGASGDTINIRYFTDATVKVNGTITNDFNIVYEDYTFSTPGLLSITKSGMTGDYSIEVEYYAKTSNILEPSTGAETTVHKIEETFTGKRPVDPLTDQIIIYDLLNSTYIEDNSTNNIPGSTALDLINNAGPMKFKWGEFHWDNYNWSDGESIDLGLKTVFDAVTDTPNTINQKFSSGCAIGDHLRFNGLNENNKGTVNCGVVYYKDDSYYLGTSVNVLSYGATTGYQSYSYDNKSETPVIVHRDYSPGLLYVAPDEEDVVNVIGSVGASETIGTADNLPWSGLTLAVTNPPEGNFEVFTIGNDATSIVHYPGVTYSSNTLEFTSDDKTAIAALGSSYTLRYVYNSNRKMGSGAGFTGALDKTITSVDKSLRQCVESSLISTVYDDVNTLISGVTYESDNFFVINEEANQIKIIESGWNNPVSDVHLVYTDTGTGDVHTINELTFDNKKYNIGNKILALGSPTDVVDSCTVDVSSNIIDNDSNYIQFAITIKDNENSFINNKIIKLESPTGRFSNSRATTGEDGIALINTMIAGPTGDISINVQADDNTLKTITIKNLGEV